MDKITEVGHKMRSAIKAKLIELGSYVDDELPDYIMVMVANHRSKEMMTEDLQLFLDENTEVFVNWLHQVLQKLHEVTVNSIDIPKITKQEARLKRKMVESKASRSLKKEKLKDKPKSKKIKKEKEENKSTNVTASITDEIPVSAKTIGERRISLNINDIDEGTTTPPIPLQDKFDIPSVAEVDKLELADIESKIEAAKKKLASLDTEADDVINIKADEEFLNEYEETTVVKLVEEKASHTPTHARIVYRSDDEPKTVKSKVSILDRLGTRESVIEKIGDKRDSPVRKKIRLSEIKKQEEELLGIANNSKRSYSNGSKREESSRRAKKHNVHDRIGVMSHVIPVPSKSRKRSRSKSPAPTNTSVSSVIQIKPRKVLPKSVQPNNKLLLKAVAEAQKSVRSSHVDNNRDKNSPDESKHSSSKKEIFTKHYKKPKEVLSKLSKETIKNIVIKVQTNEPKPEPIKHDINGRQSISEEDLDEITNQSDEIEHAEYYSDNRNSDSEVESTQKPRFIVTLDGLDESMFRISRQIETKPEQTVEKPDKSTIVNQKPPNTVKKSKSSKLQIPDIKKISKPSMNKIDAIKKLKRNPSPITFSKADLNKSEERKPERPALPLPKVYPVIPLKVKDRCKYWPGCRLADACEFLHPTQPCKMFPACKFGDRCLYIHPPCKFDVACSRRGCPYTHCYTKPAKIPLIASTVVSVPNSDPNLQTCKYFPSCSNLQCQFYHPKPCRFGKYCNNKSECNFCHTILPTKEQLRWKSST